METTKKLCLVFLLAVLFSYGPYNCSYYVGGCELTFNSLGQNWFTAYNICRAEGKQLLTQPTNDSGNRPRPGFWLAASDLGHEGSFVWRTTGMKVTYAYYDSRNLDNNLKRSTAWRLAIRWLTTRIGMMFRATIICRIFCEEIKRRDQPCV